MADVVIFPGISRLDIPVERVIEGAKNAKLESAVVMGWDDAGVLYFASSYADGGDVLWLMEKAKMALLNVQAEQ